MKHERAEVASGSGGDVKSQKLAEQATEEGQRIEVLSKRASSGSSGDAVIKSQKVAEGDKAEAGKKVKRMWTVTPEYIDRLRKEKAAGGPKVRNFDYLNDHTGPVADALRAIAARGAAVTAEMEAHKARILEEYDTCGYAQVEVVEDPWADGEMARQLMAWKKKRLQQQASS